MIEPFEIGISLALRDGVSEGIAAARKDMALVETAIRTSRTSLTDLRKAAAGLPRNAAGQPSAQIIPLATHRATVTSGKNDAATMRADMLLASVLSMSGTRPERPAEFAPRRNSGLPAPSVTAPPATLQTAAFINAAKANAATLATAPKSFAPSGQADGDRSKIPYRPPFVAMQAAAPGSERPLPTSPRDVPPARHTTHAPSPQNQAVAPPAKMLGANGPAETAGGGTAPAAPNTAPAWAPPPGAVPAPWAPPPGLNTADTVRMPFATAQNGQENTAPGNTMAAANDMKSSDTSPTQGDVFLDGMLVGRWMCRFLGREAGRHSASPTSFDPRRNPILPGATVAF